MKNHHLLYWSAFSCTSITQKYKDTKEQRCRNTSWVYILYTALKYNIEGVTLDQEEDFYKNKNTLCGFIGNLYGVKQCNDAINSLLPFLRSEILTFGGYVLAAKQAFYFHKDFIEIHQTRIRVSLVKD